MAGWGTCRNCRQAIWWGTNPYDASRVWPYDDDEEEASHFETCSAAEWITDIDGQRYRVATCRDCSARIWWETTIHGKRRPMDVDGERAGDTCHIETCGARVPQTAGKARRKAADPSLARAPYEVRLWLPDLELQWPCSAQDVTANFRRLAMQHHPDMGGNTSDFIRIKLAYDRLRQLLSRTGVSV